MSGVRPGTTGKTSTASTGRQFVDLTQPVYSGMPQCPGDPPVGVVPVLEHERDGVALAALHLGTHSGTHVDAPYHLYPYGRTISAYSPDRFVGSALVLDIRPDKAMKHEPAPEIGPESVAAAADAAGGFRPGDFALLLTGWDAHYGSSRMTAHPYLSPAAAHLLLAAGVTLVGTDALSLDYSAAAPTDATGAARAGANPCSSPECLPVHRILLGADVLVVENLRGLAELGAGRVTCIILPLHIRDGDGAPARAIAWNEGPQ